MLKFERLFTISSLYVKNNYKISKINLLYACQSLHNHIKKPNVKKATFEHIDDVTTYDRGIIFFVTSFLNKIKDLSMSNVPFFYNNIYWLSYFKIFDTFYKKENCKNAENCIRQPVMIHDVEAFSERIYF